ncbi:MULTISPECIES: HK97-gp10 family putative phage morphogenesis protein [unclassified Klebsiella]|uniref:HK97-gp10 family putative phage morphogenesis protein n=1 Tax=unclassified Klebsiella TaxID=2608929 RepID=UPI002E0D9BC9|nr:MULTISPECIES: HK97-gp10 family putative phage morphogenesis protein [unclassified Klebsiella]
MIRMEVKGLDELERQLTALGEKVATKVLRDAGREALKVVEEDMKQHAGFDEASPEEHMRDTIKIRSRKGSAKYRSTVITLRVGPSKEHHMKAVAQEFGTVKQVAEPFIRPALDYNLQKVLSVLVVEIRHGIQNG